MIRRSIILLLLATCFLVACDKHSVYHTYRSVNINGWEQSDTLRFTIPVSEEYKGQALNLYVNVRHTTAYEYGDLHLSMHSHYANDSDAVYQYLRFPLINDKGEWLGTGWGSSLQEERYINTVNGNGGDTLYIKLFHNSQRHIQGIESIGVRISTK